MDPTDASPPAALPGPPEGVSGRKVVLGCGLLFVCVLGVTLAAAVLAPQAVARRRLASRATCASQLKGLGLAALAYAQDHRGFPHVSGASELDGDPSTPDTPRAWRRLAGLGYLSDPGLLLCPSRAKQRGGVQEREARLRWLKTAPGEETEIDSPPFVRFEALSYGWTRRALSANARPDAPLAADRAVVPRRGPDPILRGTHVEGWNVLRADGSTRWHSVQDDPFPGAWLVRTKDPSKDGFLCIAPQGDPSLLR